MPEEKKKKSTPWGVKQEKDKVITKKKGKGLKPVEKKGVEVVKESPLADIDFNPFVDLPPGDEDGLNVGMFGTWGSGKTSCALSFPGPVYIVDSEKGSARVATDAQRKKGIKSMNLLVDTPNMVKLTGSIMMRNIKKDLVINTDALFARYGIAMSYIIDQVNEDPGSIGTAVIDDGGHMWKMAQEWRTDAYSYYETPEDVERLYLQRGLQGIGEGWDNARSWTVAASKLLSPIRLLKAQPVNLVIITKTKMESKQVGDGTVEWEKPNWHHEIPGLVDMVFHFEKGEPYSVKPLKARKKGTFQAYGKKLINKPMKNDSFSFDYKAVLDLINEKS